MRNETVILAENHFVTGAEKRARNHILPKSRKNLFLRSMAFFKEKLMECFKFKMPEYYKGICCRNDVGEDAFFWQKGLNSGDADLTFSNLLD